MIQDSRANRNTYFFWLLDWDKKTISILSRVQPNYTFCRIDQDEIYLQDARVRFAIPLMSIEQCATVSWASVGAKVSSNVVLTLRSPLEVLPGLVLGPRLYLLPMDVFRYDSSHAEAKALVHVLDHFRHGKSITIDPSPYVRQWKPRKGQLVPPNSWSPAQPPYVYTKNPNTLPRLLLIIALIFVLSLLLVPLLGLVLLLLSNMH